MARSSSKRANREVRRGAKQEQRRLELVKSESPQEAIPLHKQDKTPIIPRNENQALYCNAMTDQYITIGVGDAGCGKTFLSTAYAAKLLLDKEIERIVVTRPVLQADEDLGFLPGDIAEKFEPYFRPVKEVLRKRLGGSFLQYCLRPEIEKVLIAPFAFLRGLTFTDSIVILDEAQNTTVNQMKLFLTRIGEGSTVIVNGDITQCDLPKGVKSGLADLLEKVEAHQLENIEVVKFNIEDSVRSVVCTMALKLYS